MEWVSLGVGALVLLTTLLTGLVAVLVWRDGYIRGWRTSRTQPPRCPQCHYDLSGLDRCRCPECGTVYTLDQLWHHAVIQGNKGNLRSRTAPRHCHADTTPEISQQPARQNMRRVAP